VGEDEQHLQVAQVADAVTASESTCRSAVRAATRELDESRVTRQLSGIDVESPLDEELTLCICELARRCRKGFDHRIFDSLVVIGKELLEESGDNVDYLTAAARRFDGPR
jgi:hypothetical protein